MSQYYVPRDFDTNSAYKIYDFVPTTPPGVERPPEILATLSEIQSDGKVSITYDPPIAKVPDDWKYMFVQEEREKLDYGQ